VGFTQPTIPTGEAIERSPLPFSFLFALAFLVVIPEGDLLSLLSVAVSSPRQMSIELIRRLGAQENELMKEPLFQDGELIRELSKFKRDLILWGSPKVINAQLQFEMESGDTSKTLSAINRLLLAIREDIGLTNKGLSNLELMKLQIKQEDWGKIGALQTQASISHVASG
jgi:hypothetical protein